jgi:hypothetical protein
MKRYLLTALLWLVAVPVFAAGGTYIISDFSVTSGANKLCGWDDAALDSACFDLGTGLSISGGTLSTDLFSFTTDNLAQGATNKYFTDERAQDAIGAMVDSTLVYVDATPLLTRAALTGAITASQGSNTTALGSFSSANLSTALTDETGGAGVAVFASSPTITTPSFTTGFTIGGAAASGKFIVGNGTNYIASTSTIPTSAGATANKVLLSDGTNYVLSTPTFPNASATSGKFIRSDGTNWIASTGSASGIGSCTNQFVTATNSDAAPTCSTATLAGAQFANQGTTTTVLHGNAAGNPSFAAVSLSADVSGDLPFANLTQGSALSVLGVATNGTADVASIAAGSDNQVLRRSGTSLAFGAVDVSQAAAVTGIMGSANGGTGNGFTKFTGPAASEKSFALPNASDTIAAWGIANAYTGANTQTAGSYTFSDNIPLQLGAVGQLYSDATNTILNPVSGQISIGPTATTSSASAVSQTGATSDLLVDQIGLGGSPISAFYWINYDLTTTAGRGALNFNQKYTGSGAIQVGVSSIATYAGSGASPLNISMWAQGFLNADNSGTSNTGMRTTAGLTSGQVISQGTHNIFGLQILDGGDGGTHSGGTIRRWGIQQTTWGALAGTATSTDWGAFFGNDLAVGSDVKRYVEGSVNTKGDSYDVFNAATTDWDFFVDGTKVATLDNDAIDVFVPVNIQSSLQTDSIVNDTGLAAGTWTPTLTNVANLAASTAYQCQYMRVGDTVTASCKVDIDPTLAATSTQLGISLPVASNFGAVEDCAGTAAASGIAGQVAAIIADAANDRCQLQYISGDITNQPMYLVFTYQVI